MEVDPSFSSLLQSLKVDEPWLPPKNWESILSENGAAAQPAHPSCESKEALYETPVVSETILVRLVINALLGLKSSLIEIERLSTDFCLSPADRTSRQVPSMWHRSSSSSALGKILKSIGRVGRLVFFLRNFVDYFVPQNLNIIGGKADKDGGVGNQYDHKVDENNMVDGEKVCLDKKMGQHPPFTLVNQAFSKAVGKVLEGYIGAFNTLLTSVSLRRSIKSTDTSRPINAEGSLTIAINSEITVMEVYLHSRELRTRIEVLANICFPNLAEVAPSVLNRKDLANDAELEFQKFPKGADLLTYLYVQLRDADPVHQGLLKFLFARSCEPYIRFIKLWIYEAQIDDPYEEFFIEFSDTSLTSNITSGPLVGNSLASVKERGCVSTPCFLQDICRPLMRAGQQLQVLVKLLNMWNYAFVGCQYYGTDAVPFNLANFEDILQCGEDVSTDSQFLLNPLPFDGEQLRTLMCKRESMYKIRSEKLENFLATLDMKNLQMHHPVNSYATIASFGDERSDIYSWAYNNVNFNIFSNNEREAANVPTDRNDSDCNSTCDELAYEIDPINSSECSSWSSDGETPPEGISELPDVELQMEKCQFSFRSACLARTSTKSKTAGVCKKSAESEGPFSLPHCSPKKGDRPGNQHHQHLELRKIPDRLQSVDVQCAGISVTLNDDLQSGRCWPLGGLLQNPFYVNMKHRGPRKLHFMECSREMVHNSAENVEVEKPCFNEISVSNHTEVDTMGVIKYLNQKYGSLYPSSTHQPWNSYNSFDLSASPLVTKAVWLPTLRSLRHGNSMKCMRSFPSYFDFFSVSDPCKVYMEELISNPVLDPQAQTPVFAASGVSTREAVNNESDDHGQENIAGKSSGKSLIFNQVENLFSGNLPEGTSGGAQWERSLTYSCQVPTQNAGGAKHVSVEVFETPIDIVIDQCILQEVLLQYNYISNFTIKLLEEGFDLHQHLLALRRYHLMELADWTDLFIQSLRNQKWYVTEPEQKIADIQGLLDLALQRSSCERDQYKERLFIGMTKLDRMPSPTSSSGVSAFDFMILGYRVDWPINIVVTQAALQIYADIFNYLVQVKLAVLSLTDVWRSLKALMSSTCHSRRLGSREMQNFNILTKMRQQISHFVSTFQRYLHSQLSEVSWCRFQQSLKNQVKDVLGLEMVHMSYLSEALHICFMSTGTKDIAAIIKNILQCALDFGLIFSRNGFDIESDGVDSSVFLSEITFSQVFAIRSTFEENLRELYLLYLKSPKHDEFGLCRLWGYLDYNEYYSATISNRTSYLYG